MSHSTTLEAAAKLTWSLDVTGIRADGYHLINALMLSLDICDTITITENSNTSLSVSGPFAHGVPTDERNLVYKALQLVGKSAHIHIEKNIPHGGGLGGGSTDAAAVLRWAGFTDLIAASRIGADVPFCIEGTPAQVSGIGEILTPSPYISQQLTLIIPPLEVSTPRVYAAWDELGGPRGKNGNDLEPAALHAYPELEKWRHTIAEALQTEPRLAGSGATWFVPGHVQPADESLSQCTLVHTKTRPNSGRVS